MGDRDSPLSQASLVRQVNRAGKRWGLVADVDPDFGVGVAEVIHRAETKYGLGEIVKDGRWRLMTVTDEAPFSAVLGNRINNGETSIASKYREARRLEKEAQAKAAAELNAYAKDIWRTRNRITAIGDMIIPAGLRERARRRRER